jgi:LacI family transcriptional regulator, repressor for deo operon, udp, cdd, tsx, nupC, and nupG
MAGRRGVTSIDVARRAGVSQATVSLVLNGADSKVGVSAATRARVLTIASELGYTPNHAARSLRRRSTNIVTFILPDPGNLYFAEIAAAAQEEAEARGYALNLVAARTEAAERQALERLRAGVSDGAIVIGRSRGVWEELRGLALRGIACVALQDASAGAAQSIPCVRADLESGGYLATSHLLGLGHRRIAHVTDRRHDDDRPRERLDGYLRAMREAGITPQAEWVVEAENSLQGGSAAMHWLMTTIEPRPTAVFLFNDRMAIGALHALDALGLDVPHDVAVVGFDGIALGAFTHPELTTIDHPREEIGRLAIQIVLDRLEGKPTPQPSPLPVRLLVRQSCGAQSRGTPSCSTRQRDASPPPADP